MQWGTRKKEKTNKNVLICSVGKPNEKNRKKMVIVEKNSGLKKDFRVNETKETTRDNRG
jgi:hypothetical protein